MAWLNSQDNIRPSSSSYSAFAPSHHNQQHQRSDDASTPQPGMMASSFGQHRRTETAPVVGSSSSLFYGQQSGSHYRDDSQDHVFDFNQPTSAFQASNVGAVRVHQFFPTMGETGVPVTFLMTVKADWARNVGLQLGDRRTGSLPMWSDNTTRAPSHLVVSFGGIDVETRTERSMAGIESSSYAFNDSQSDVDLTVIAYAPPYPGSPLSHPSMGGKVSIRIKLVGPMIDPNWEAMANGVDVGEFSYWQVSPKSNLKRPGSQLAEQQPTLRRPASFPNFNTATGPVEGSRESNMSNGIKRRGGHNSQAGRPTLSHHRSQLSISALQQSQHHQQQQQQQQQHLQQQQLYHQQQQGVVPSSSSFNFSPEQTNFASSSVRPQFRANQYGAEQDGRGPMQVDGNPPLIRSSQLYQSGAPSVTSFSSSALPNTSYDAMATTSSSSPSSSPPIDGQNSSQRANLEIHGDLQDMALGWSHDEWRNGRRLVQFWRKQEGTTIHAVCRPIEQEQYIPNSIVVSCIFWQVTNECYITSVDIIYLLEALVASRFNVEEKNRIRRNLEGLKPKTISKLGKSHDDRINSAHESFFKLVMSFSDPRPRHIEKDIKIFPWKVLAPALHKIISKYSAASAAAPNLPISPASSMPSMHNGHGSTSTSSYKQESVSGSSTNHSPPQFSTGLGQSHDQALSIDVAASNSAFHSMQAGHLSHQSSHDNSLSSGSSTFLSPSLSPKKGSLASANNTNNSNNGPVNFNFSDFVVSPMAFGQTPMSQSQATQPLPSSQSSPFLSSQQYNNRIPAMQSSSSPNVLTGLGMDLGTPRRD